MKPAKTINLQGTDNTTGPSRVKHVSHGKVTSAIDVSGDEALLDTDEDKILHLHDSIVGEEKIHGSTSRKQ